MNTSRLSSTGERQFHEGQRERGKRGASTFTDENVCLLFQKSKPLKKIFTEKESVYCGSPQLRALEPAPTPVTQAAVMGGTISIAEGQSRPEMPMQLLNCPDAPLSRNISTGLL